MTDTQRERAIFRLGFAAGHNNAVASEQDCGDYRRFDNSAKNIDRLIRAALKEKSK